MYLRVREATARDLHPCLATLDGDAELASVRDPLARLWQDHLRAGALRLRVVEDLDRPAGPVAFSAAAFVATDFLASARAGVIPHPTMAVVRLHAEGRSPILRSEAIRRANSSAGLNLLVLNTGGMGAASSQEEAAAIGILRAADLMATHEGYRVREFLMQAYDDDSCRFGLNLGAFPRSWNAAAGGRPVLLGLTRQEALGDPGRWLSRLFVWRCPRIFFPRGEQQVLALAMEGAGDGEICETLHLSLSGVKKRWAKIFERALVHAPGLLPGAGEAGHGRGAEKRRHLLRYLRDHPEELRPAELRRRPPDSPVRAGVEPAPPQAHWAP